jgi:hypothetical protein
MRAPDWWESARFQALFLARSWLRQNGVASSHPPAGNASRWHALLGSEKSKDVQILGSQTASHDLVVRQYVEITVWMITCAN